MSAADDFLAALASGRVPGHYIVVLNDGADRAVAVREARSLGGEVTAQYQHALNGFAARLPAAAVARLTTNPAVLFMSEERDFTISAFEQFTPRGIDRIDADLSSTASGDGSGFVDVDVAILDTGIDATHADLNVVGA